MKQTVIILFVFVQIQLFAQKPAADFSGMQWQYIGDAGFTPEIADYMKLTFHPVNGLPWVAFEESMVASVMKFNGTQWEYVGSPGFSNSQAVYPSMAFCPLDGKPYIAYSDLNPSNHGVTVKSFDGISWTTVGNSGVGSSWIAYPDLKFCPSDGKPFVVFSDVYDSAKATVVKFDGTQWVTVGPAGFTSEGACFTSLGFDSLGFSYVAYGGDAYYPEIKASVMKYNGSQWEYMGSKGFSAGAATFTNIAFSSSGILYVAYSDLTNDRKATVKMFDSSDWLTVGQEGFSAGGVQDLSLAISPAGQPYVTFCDWVNFAHATAMRYDGSTWVTIGSPGFTSDTATMTNISFNSTGNPCVVYQDWEYSGKATAMVYDYPVGNIKLDNSSISVYPNPTSDRLRIVMNQPGTSENVIEIFNIIGQKLYETQFIGNSIMLHLKEYSRGTYLLKITNGTSVYKRMIYKN
jgi:hypothetical protein